ncbi:MAG: hypothetical protein A2W03_08550 [Candidatus Aminicenantes bacterium RBG_16_63_16]|nr:MAG: hypothetical protein A2W03_08550 [Candidatus Aminicenantes bacterium RBG_16_63_16]
MNVKWQAVLTQFAAMPLFHSSMLRVFPDEPAVIQVQLSRWVKAGRLVRLRRQWYLINKPWRAKDVPLSYIAAQIVRPSYLSLEWALQHHGLIPDAVQNPTSVTTSRPQCIRALDRLFLYFHVRPELLTGFRLVSDEGWPVPVASAEKALFDKVYFHVRRRPFSADWLKELRLQNLAAFDIENFLSFGDKSSKWGLRAALRAAADIISQMQKERR